MRINFKHILVITLLLLTSVYSQDAGKASEPQLIDTLGKSNGETRSAAFDDFFIRLNNDPDAIGYVFVFCGKSCRYGEIESHLRGIELKIARYRFDRARIVVQNGGYRDAQEVEFWLKTKDTSPPTPRSTRNIKNVTFVKANGRIIEPYDCCGNLDVEWRSFRPKN